MTTYNELRDLLLTARRLRKARAPQQEREQVLKMALRNYLLHGDSLTNSQDYIIWMALRYERHRLAYARSPKLPVFKAAS